MIPDAGELVLFEGSQNIGDTYVFEPSKREAALGVLYAVTEVEVLDGIGKEVIDTAIQALQKEYYRDPKRGVLASFESALHQANLVLHDLSEQGIREWMRHFNVAVGILAETKNNSAHLNQEDSNVPSMTLHASTAGDGIVMLARSHKLSTVSAGLSHSPVTNPLRTFSSVASGVVTERDILFIGTSNFDQVYSNEDLVRFVVDQSAETIAIHLSQLYEDQKKTAPVAAIVVTMLDKEPTQQDSPDSSLDNRNPIAVGSSLNPRRPLIISSSIGKRVLSLSGQGLTYSWGKLKRVVWPFLKEGSRKGGKAVFVASKSAGRSIQSLANKKNGQTINTEPGLQGGIYNESVPTKPATLLNNIKKLPVWLLQKLTNSIKTLPKSSKVFGVIAIILVMLLGVSVVLLQKKRAADVQIQQASEFLHEARTKKEAAETALIYDNRDQARALLTDAQQLADRVELTGLYQEQRTDLVAGITIVQDRLDKVTRASEEITKELGDFSTVIPSETPTKIFHLNNSVYSFDPKSNVIVRMDENGSVEKTSKSTQGIGFFTQGSTHEADKSIILITDEPGLAIFDAKTGIVQKQEIQMPSDQAEITAVSTFGNRLYVYDKTSNNVYGFSKTLRGYSGGSPWISGDSFPTDNIIDVGVDGYIYTLHNDGAIRKLLKGEAVDFKLEAIEPSIAANASLLVNEELRHLYVFDPANKRVVVFDTVGNLTKQIFLGEDSTASDITVSVDETSLYVLEGTRVLMISLED